MALTWYLTSVSADAKYVGPYVSGVQPTDTVTVYTEFTVRLKGLRSSRLGSRDGIAREDTGIYNKVKKKKYKIERTKQTINQNYKKNTSKRNSKK